MSQRCLSYRSDEIPAPTHCSANLSASSNRSRRCVQLSLYPERSRRTILHYAGGYSTQGFLIAMMTCALCRQRAVLIGVRGEFTGGRTIQRGRGRSHSRHAEYFLLFDPPRRWRAFPLRLNRDVRAPRAVHCPASRLASLTLLISPCQMACSFRESICRGVLR